MFLLSLFMIVFSSIFSANCSKSCGNKSFHQNVCSAHGFQTRVTRRMSLQPLILAKLYFMRFYCNCFPSLYPVLLYLPSLCRILNYIFLIRARSQNHPRSKSVNIHHAWTCVFLTIKCLTCCTDFSNTFKCFASC